ncbi:MAG: cupin domain-containing protein [bacterium]|nr:cupin domain-containing protein [bacterium]
MRPENLVEHPEGGRFREVFRSDAVVLAGDGRSRSALTHIYFSLDPGEVSRFHRVASDEIWNLYRGDGVRLHLWEGGEAPPTRVTLSADTERFCHVVPAGTWQAAEPLGGTVLVGCSVAPGFDFVDFEMLDPSSAAAARLRTTDPGLARCIGAAED